MNTPSELSVEIVVLLRARFWHWRTRILALALPQAASLAVSLLREIPVNASGGRWDDIWAAAKWGLLRDHFKLTSGRAPGSRHCHLSFDTNVGNLKTRKIIRRAGMLDGDYKIGVYFGAEAVLNVDVSLNVEERVVWIRPYIVFPLRVVAIAARS